MLKYNIKISYWICQLGLISNNIISHQKLYLTIYDLYLIGYDILEYTYYIIFYLILLTKQMSNKDKIIPKLKSHQGPNHNQVNTQN